MANHSPDVVVIDGTPRVSSLSVAEHFGKPHKNVLASIRQIAAECPAEFSELNFQPAEYIDEQGKPRIMYQLTRDAFTLLAMGFTGKKALAWKLRYIEAFNAMEKELVEKSKPRVISYFYPDPLPPSFMSADFLDPEKNPAGYGHPDWKELIKVRDEWMEVEKYDRRVAMDQILDYIGAGCLDDMKPGQLRKATAWVKEKIAMAKAQAEYEARSKSKKKGSAKKTLPVPEHAESDSASEKTLKIHLPASCFEKLKYFGELMDTDDMDALGGEFLIAALLAWDTYSQIGFLREKCMFDE